MNSTKLLSAVITELSEIDNCSFTSDLWTGCHNRAYISLTVHFITPSIEIKNFCLITKEVPENHTAINLTEVLQSAIDDWELSNKVYDR